MPITQPGKPWLPSGQLTASTTVKTGEGVLVGVFCEGGTCEVRDGTGDTDTPIIVTLSNGEGVFVPGGIRFADGLRVVVSGGGPTYVFYR